MMQLTEADVVRMVRASVKAVGIRPLARDWGVSPAYLCHVCKGKTRPGESILKALGLERVVTYRRIKVESR